MHQCQSRSSDMIAASTLRGLVLALLLASMPALSPAQDAASLPPQRELQHLQQRIEHTKQAQERLRREQQALEQETRRISAELVRLAARVQALEQRIVSTSQRIAALEKKRGRLLARLQANHATTAQLLAILQRLRRDPPPPFVTRPDDVLAAVRGALAVSAVLPRLDERARRLRTDLRKLAQLQLQLRAARADQRNNLDAMRRTSGKLQGMLKLKEDLLGRTRRQMAAQQAELARLLRQATTLNELVRAVERRRAQAVQQAPRHPPPQQGHRQQGEGQTPPTARPQPANAPLRRLAPQQPFATLRGRLPWPAQGRRVAGFGQRNRLLGELKGLYLATLPSAVITAPADAQVLLAGRFRGYGKLVILNVGQGYRILLAGLKEVSVHAGEVLRAGEPVGRMGRRAAPSTVVDEKIAATRPILYMELRKGRKLLDPSAWFVGGRQARRN